MGIQGLLPTLKSICRKSHIKAYANQKVAVDAYVWLHRGAYSCSAEICQNIKTDKYIKYCMHMVNMLKHHKVIPVLVFDGARLPSKSGTEGERHDRRKENMQKARQMLQMGNRAAADEFFRKAVDITPQMAHSLIEELRKSNVEFIVSPYEADAQLAYLAITGYVSCVVTEDSDLVPYGAPRILFKMDKYGEGLEYRKENLGVNRELDFSSFTHDMVVRMCVLSGCDYLSSLQGIGVKTAHKIVKEHKTIANVMTYLKRSMSNVPIPDDYEERLKRAELTFRHQRAFDPRTQQLIHLSPLPEDANEEDYHFCGPFVEPDVIRRVCNGELDPTTHRPFTSEIRSSKVWTTKPSASATSSNSQTNKISTYFRPSTAIVKRPFIPPRRLSSQESAQRAASQDKTTTSNISTPSEVKKKVIVKSKYFVNTSSQSVEKSSVELNDVDRGLSDTNNSTDSQTSVDVEGQTSLLSSTSTTTITPSDQTILSQQSVQSISSQDQEGESPGICEKNVKQEVIVLTSQTSQGYKSPYFSSPLLNNSLPKIGMVNNQTATRRVSAFSRFFSKTKLSSFNSSQNSSSSADGNSQDGVILIDDKDEEEEEKFSSQTSFCYDYIESPPRKRKQQHHSSGGPPEKKSRCMIDFSSDCTGDSNILHSLEDCKAPSAEDDDDIMEILPQVPPQTSSLTKIFRQLKRAE